MYRDLALYYARNGTLWLAVWGNFILDGQQQPINYTVTAAREFRYDNPRQRYMTRDYTIAGNAPANWTPNDTASWTDYNGMMPYLDFDLSSDVNDEAVVDEVTRYLAGMGIAARQDDATGDDEFLHGDLIRSTMLTTDETGAVNDRMAYTAFGQLVTSSGIGGELPAGFPRYAYAGGWGYESGLLVLDGASGTESIVLAHVGARWYQADTGRFIMRDPTGIEDQLNVYVYDGNDPVISVDPEGEVIVWIVKGARGIWRAVSRTRALRAAKAGKEVKVIGQGSRTKAKGLAKEAWPGRRIKHHNRHAKPHFQPKKRPPGPKNHIWHEVLMCVLMAKEVANPFE